MYRSSLPPCLGSAHSYFIRLDEATHRKRPGLCGHLQACEHDGAPWQQCPGISHLMLTRRASYVLVHAAVGCFCHPAVQFRPSSAGECRGTSRVGIYVVL